MLDTDTFLTILYVTTDDFCKGLPAPALRPGPCAALSRSEVITLAVFGQWAQFQSERGFYRFALRRLRPAFPTLPDYGQFNRLLQQAQQDLVSFFLHLVGQLQPDAQTPYLFEVLDGFGVATRHCKRRGEGWLPGRANIGYCGRLGWYEGFHVLTSVTPDGVLTGFGFAAASTKDQHLAETFFALRQKPDARLLSVGKAIEQPYATDKGFDGYDFQMHWREDYDVATLAPPRVCDRRFRLDWPASWRGRLASLRQIVETVHGKLLKTFRLENERPHTLAGFQARLAAKACLHNFSIWLNLQLGRKRLAFADLIDW